MANMSYCRFENTYIDLLDCLRAMDDDLSKRERECKRQLIKLCQKIIEEHAIDDSITNNDEDYDRTSWDMQSK